MIPQTDPRDALRYVHRVVHRRNGLEGRTASACQISVPRSLSRSRDLKKGLDNNTGNNVEQVHRILASFRQSRPIQIEHVQICFDFVKRTNFRSTLSPKPATFC